MAKSKNVGELAASLLAQYKKQPSFWPYNGAEEQRITDMIGDDPEILLGLGSSVSIFVTNTSVDAGVEARSGAKGMLESFKDACEHMIMELEGNWYVRAVLHQQGEESDVTALDEHLRELLHQIGQLHSRIETALSGYHKRGPKPKQYARKFVKAMADLWQQARGETPVRRVDSVTGKAYAPFYDFILAVTEPFVRAGYLSSTDLPGDHIIRSMIGPERAAPSKSK